jgi:hypothetical protein
VPSGLLTLLKYVFLVLLYLFFLRVLRAVWVELREPKPSPVPADVPAGEAAFAAPSDGGARYRGPGGTGAAHLRIAAPADRQGMTYALGDELTVGRATGCGVSIPDDTFVSQMHARVFRRDGELFVEDLGSTNGTLLNDRKVSGPVPMRPGDVLQVGRTALELVS